jgi:hypothetical protein
MARKNKNPYTYVVSYGFLEVYENHDTVRFSFGGNQGNNFKTVAETFAALYERTNLRFATPITFEMVRAVMHKEEGAPDYYWTGYAKKAALDTLAGA